MGLAKKVRRYTKLRSTQPPGIADAAAVTAAPQALTQLTAPAGGTGTADGGWDTAGNRDLAIASINAAKADIATQKAELDKLITDVSALRTKLNAVISAMEARGVIATVN